MRILAPAALVGVVAGLGLGLGANVSGVVLAFYGLAAGALLAVLVRAAGARAGLIAAGGAVLAALVVLAAASFFDDDTAERRAAADLPLAERPAVSSSGAPPTDDPVAREARPTQLERPDPSDYPVGSARRAAAEFLDAWHDRSWERMATWTAPLWRDELPDPAASLRFRFGAERLRGSFQRSLRPLGPDRAELVVDLAATELTPEVERRRVTMDLRRTDGRWGVQPISVAPSRVREEGR